MKAIRVGICVLIAFAVISFGGVEPWGKAILEIGAAALFVWWGILAIRRREAEIHGNWLYLPLLGLGGLGIAQVVFGLSVYPYLTRSDLLLWGAYLILVFLTVESFRTVEEGKRFAWFLAGLAFAVSLSAIVQHFTFNGKLYWFITLPRGDVPFGPFVNHNHFAGFLELALPPGLALLLFSGVPWEKRVLLWLFTIVPIGALLLSASRGGIFGFLFGFLMLCVFAGVFAKRKHAVMIAGLVVALSGIVIVWLGARHTIARFEQMTLASEMGPDGRLTFYQGAWRICLSHPWTGTGVGTFETAYPRYETEYSGNMIVNHAHDDYLELLADTGLAGGICILAFIVLLYWRGLANLRAAETRPLRAIVAGSLASCSALLLHSVVDFNFHIPSNALLFLLLAFLATSQMIGPNESRPSQLFDDIRSVHLRHTSHSDRSTIVQ
jgi:O-antigen ligase